MKLAQKRRMTGSQAAFISLDYKVFDWSICELIT